MPSFSFSIVKKKYKTKHESNIIISNVKGVVFINIEGKYTVKILNEYYPIHHSNYTCKGKPIVYSQKLTDLSQRLIYVRTEDDAVELPHHAYLPFTVGCIVLGNVIKGIGNSHIFYIKRVSIDPNNEESKIAMKFYKDNYEVIQKNRMENL